MKLFAGIVILGVTNAQFDYESGVSSEFDPLLMEEVNDVIRRFGDGDIVVNQGISISPRSGIPNPIMQQFAGRQLPPGIKLEDFLGPNGFDTMGFLTALQDALVAQETAEAQALNQPDEQYVEYDVGTDAEVILDPPAYDPIVTDIDYSVSFYDESANSALESSVVASSDVETNRPANTSEGDEVKTFLGLNTSTQLRDVEFNKCRICENETAEACALKSLTDCYDYWDDQTDDRVCMLTSTQWMNRDGTKDVRYTSRCVTPQACQAQIRQNFVGPYRLHQCKKESYMTVSRYRYHDDVSVCHFCQKMADSTGVNAFFQTDSSTVFTGVTVTSLLETPENWGTHADTTPYGQLFAQSVYETTG